LFLIAAILGDSMNYFIGNYFGEKVFSKSRFFKKEHLEKTKDFYKKHGGKTIIYARFIPIVRTFAPFVAGICKMEYKKFLSYNIVGGIVWVTLFLFGGYFFGRIEWVEKNLTLLIYLIIGFSVLPIIIEFLKAKIFKKKKM
jgi:membrane-associated protein